MLKNDADIPVPRIRPATASEADVLTLAQCLVWAEGEMAYRITNTTDAAGAVAAMRDFILSPRLNRFSPANALVAEVAGRNAGACFSFPAARQPELDGLILEALRRRGLNLPALAQEGEAGSYYLYTLGVDPAFRRVGIGSALTRASLEKALEQGFHRASILVEQGNAASLRMSQGYGFGITGEVRIADTLYYRLIKDI